MQLQNFLFLNSYLSFTWLLQPLILPIKQIPLPVQYLSSHGRIAPVQAVLFGSGQLAASCAASSEWYHGIASQLGIPCGHSMT